MKRQHGVALMTVIVVSAVVLVVLSAGLKLGNSGVLFVSQVHKRNVALSAAEAGVYEAILALQKNRLAQGTFQGQLSESGASYSYTLENRFSSHRDAVVTSTGEYGDTKRSLKVLLEPDSAGFSGASLGAKVYVFDQAYFNAVASSDNPVARPGNAHSNYTKESLSFVGRDYDGNGRWGLHATGTLSAGTNIDQTLNPIARDISPNTTRDGYRLNRQKMLSQGGFTTRSTSELRAGGHLSSNVVVDGPIEIVGKLFIPKDVTLHVRGGKAEFLGGVSGDGQIVVDGDVLVRTDSALDSSVKEGTKIFSEGSAFIVHPTTSGGEEDLNIPPPNIVGDYFAQMPLEATYELSTNLPINAPQGGEFFSWVNSQVGGGGGDSNFQLWYNGDGTDIYPGLSEETKTWLNNSRPIQQHIQTWADGP